MPLSNQIIKLLHVPPAITSTKYFNQRLFRALFYTVPDFAKTKFLVGTMPPYTIRPHQMKRTILFCLFVSISVYCSGQGTSNTKLNSISFELGKNGLIYNLYFDRRLTGKPYGFRFGMGSNLAQYLSAKSVGVGAYHLVGKRRRFFESGVELQYLMIDEVSDDQKGLAFLYPDHSTNGFAPFLNLGYRHAGNFGLFRIGLSPGLIDGKFVPGGYISYGISF